MLLNLSLLARSKNMTICAVLGFTWVLGSNANAGNGRSLSLYLSGDLFAGAPAPRECTAETEVGTTCICSLSEIHPTQFSVGIKEVHRKQREIQDIAYDKSKLDEFKITHPEPAVRGPRNTLYIIDHHHLALALLNETQKTSYCQILADYSLATVDEFWEQMTLKKWVYPYDENGEGPQPFASIPNTVYKLKDDPYRSLAGFVLDAGGYEKSPEPFEQFLWADFFRTRIPLIYLEKNFDDAVKKGVALAHSPDARGLPGYTLRRHKKNGVNSNSLSPLFGWLFDSNPQSQL